MPYVSKAQQGAMYAAASGHSTLGIPKSVGQKFVAAGPAAPKLPEHVKRAARNSQLRAGKIAPTSHHEFHLLGAD